MQGGERQVSPSHTSQVTFDRSWVCPWSVVVRFGLSSSPFTPKWYQLNNILHLWQRRPLISSLNWEFTNKQKPSWSTKKQDGLNHLDTVFPNKLNWNFLILYCFTHLNTYFLLTLNTIKTDLAKVLHCASLVCLFKECPVLPGFTYLHFITTCLEGKFSLTILCYFRLYDGICICPVLSIWSNLN